jgi:hypothetical protein
MPALRVGTNKKALKPAALAANEGDGANSDEAARL